ncbi:MAG: DUF262 domain-containing protein [Acidimicrobiia bacterium]|nr:DUF262 domain-containing protein [Acidimicrobiia bacterium]
MKSDTVDLKLLFGKDVRYLVPLFQRPYVWNQVEHWEPLWSDVTPIVESYRTTPEDAAPHFLGAVVLDHVSTQVAELEARQVIDGQQRLTTLQILIAACRDVAQGRSFDKQARVLAKLTENDQDLIVESHHLLKVWPTNVDRASFEAVMAGRVKEADRNSPITRCYQYFTKTASQWLEEAEDDAEAALGALTSVLRSLLKVVVIDLERNDNAQVIFETLNARGTPLRASDLIKNLLFQRATDAGEPVEHLYETYWRELEEPRWRKEIRQGRLKRLRLDLFLSHYLTMRNGKEVSVPSLFDQFRTFTTSSWSESVEDLLKDLRKYAAVYDLFDNLSTDDPRGLFFYRLRTMQITTADPLLLYLFGLEDDGMASDSLDRVLRRLEDYLVRRMACRLTTKNYNIVFLGLLQAVQEDPTNADTVTERHLSALEGDSQLWPDDKAFRTALETGELYRALSRARLRIVLEALETASKTKYAETLLVLDKLTIEHLMPQAWQAHWPLPSDKHPLAAEKEREQRIHRLGNLTLVTERLNPKLSNGSWAAKRADILEHSALSLNRSVPPQWDEDAIDNRGGTLADVAISIWPGPSDGARQDIATYAEEPEEEPLRTEPISAEDLSLGLLRIPVEAAALFPADDGEVTVILRGMETSGSWQAGLAGDGDGFGALTLDPSLLGRLAEEDDSMIITGHAPNGVFVD